jgi:RNA polymerase sigma-70 factor (ECF subfamily)
MQVQHAPHHYKLDELADVELVELARRQNGAAFRVIMQRNNQRLFRIARAVAGDDSEAEDVVQAAYVNAYASLGSFRGEAHLATWLTRIVLNEALGRRRRQRPVVGLEVLDAGSWRGGPAMSETHGPAGDADPERAVARRQVRQLIETAVDGLPEGFRVVFVMRDVQELSIEETADVLGLPPATVKTRLHRARQQLRRTLDAQLSSVLGEAFPFDGARCSHTADVVLQRIGLAEAPAGRRDGVGYDVDGLENE